MPGKISSAKFDKKGLFHKTLLFMEKLCPSKQLMPSYLQTKAIKMIAIERCNKHKDRVFVVRNGPDLSKIIFMDPNDNLKNGFDYLGGLCWYYRQSGGDR